VNFNGANIPLGEDSRLEIAPVNSVVSAALYGDIDEVYTDLIVKGTGTPLTYDNLAVLWPYLQPVIGGRIFGNADAPLQWVSNNGDVITVRAGAVTRLPGGHPEGYIEAFAVLYREFADAIVAWKQGIANPLPPTLPGIVAGVRGMRFIERAIESSGKECWVEF